MSKPWKTNVTVWNSRKAAHETVSVEIDIDWHGVAKHLAKKAIMNKSGRSAILSGLVVGKVKLS